MKNETNIKIAKKYIPMIELIEKDSDGYWCYLNNGYKTTSTDSYTIHEWNMIDFMYCIRHTIKKVIEEI